VNWFSETLLNLFNSRILLQDSYVSMMSRVMALAAYNGPVIIVGRGGHLVLPPASGLRVRVVAPRQLRIQALAQREGLDERTAAHRLAAIDRSRADFVRRHFHSDLAEAEKFDLVVNTGTFGLTGAAELIRRALEMRGFIE
jgi:cytidylate kinase